MVSILARYQELALKGRNRPWFVRQLVRHVKAALAGLHVREVRLPMGRVEIVLDRDDTVDEARARLGRVFGLANFSVARRVPLDVEAMSRAIVAALPSDGVSTFAVRVRRADKQYPVTSPALAGELGARIQAARGWKVDLDHAELTVSVEIVPGDAYCYLDKEPGPGGLPTGTSGRVMALLSGGLDSPVAAWRMMRRGCRVSLVHFHSQPFLSRASEDKARRLAALLTTWQLRSRLFIVPFGELQRQVTLSVPGHLRVVIYRRLMLRIAERLAGKVHARALVTGDVIGQVASQTVENIVAIDSATRMPIFRPLVSLDKEEIVAEARRLGTFGISILPDEDCCTLFTPRHPETHARRDTVEQAEQMLPIDEMVHAAADSASVEQLAWPVLQSPVAGRH
jgi:thiamine biosynthesis protein ThiI